LGYDLKLSWPKVDDTRRFVHDLDHYILPIRSSSFDFVSTSSDDIDKFFNLGMYPRECHQPLKAFAEFNKKPTSFDVLWLSRLPPRAIHLNYDLNSQGPFLPASYDIRDLVTDTIADYASVARLASSSLENDDLYNLLLKLSMNDDEPPAMAARHAISALSYQHFNLEKALSHQMSAICALQVAIESFDPSRALQTIAASMLLNIFEVRPSMIVHTHSVG
jgi:hypothetical protein